MFKRNYILFIASILVTGCFTIKLDKNKTEPGFSGEHIPLIKEMAEYCLLFSRHHNVDHIYTDDIADRKTRKKMYTLGSEATITFQSQSQRFSDSTIVFESKQVGGEYQYEVEYFYDFAIKPVNRTNVTENNADGYLVKVTDRIYYRITRRKRDRFPIM
ncbi:MAG TPA: hypothetical protein VGO58_19285 [Chitinophagaceae bacterium]|nr:hypothetical protein [Chitinophagaceae bacterium]